MSNLPTNSTFSSSLRSKLYSSSTPLWPSLECTSQTLGARSAFRVQNWRIMNLVILCRLHLRGSWHEYISTCPTLTLKYSTHRIWRSPSNNSSNSSCVWISPIRDLSTVWLSWYTVRAGTVSVRVVVPMVWVLDGTDEVGGILGWWALAHFHWEHVGSLERLRVAVLLRLPQRSDLYLIAIYQIDQLIIY